MSDIPQEFTREQFEEEGIEVTAGEIRAVNQNVYMLDGAFTGARSSAVFVEDNLGEDIPAERLAMLTDYARNVLREEN